MKNGLKVVFLLLACMLVGTSAALADNFEVDRVEVDDMLAEEGGDAVFVERGQDAIVEVYLQGIGTSDNVRIKAYIGGYEHDDVEAKTDIFEVEPGVDYRKVLRLSIPEDLEANDDYTLRVKVYDDDDELQKNYVLRVKEPRHSLKIQDVIVRPSSSIEAGRPVFVTVRVENLGAKKEEDIKVVVSVPELGISARDYIDELTANENADEEEDNEDEEDSMSSNEIMLRLPTDASAGTYDLDVRVEYNRGHNTVSTTETLTVLAAAGSETPEDTLVETVISVDSGSKTVTQEGEVGYRLMVANLGSEAVLYSVEVAGEQLFADARVEPNFLTISPDNTGEFLVYLKAKSDASEGRHLFVAKVKSGNAVIQELSLTADVKERTVATGMFDGDIKQAVWIGVVVLVVILIIVGLVVAFSRKGDEEPGAGEGQSYYYYPKY